MNLEYILNIINNKKEASFDIEVFESIAEFQSKKRISSMESLALELSGHSPLYMHFFEYKKVEEWAEANGLEVYFSEMTRTLHFKKTKEVFKMEVEDSDIATVEALHDLLLDNHGYSLSFVTLKKARELTAKMYKAIKK